MRDDELDEEVRADFEMEIEDRMRAGMSREKALQRARRDVGSVEALKEKVRDVRIGVSVDNFLRDLRYAARTMRKSPVFVLFVVLTLGLGIGANTTVFTVINTLILNPLPVPESSGLTAVGVARSLRHKRPWLRHQRD